jgi:transcription antitermination factor NusG
VSGRYAVLAVALLTRPNMAFICLREAPSWYALEVKRRCEKNTAALLAAKGFEDYLPTYQPKHRWKHRAADVQLALFAGYLFCRFPETHRLQVLTTPGVYRVVSFCNRPAPVDEQELADLRNLLASTPAITQCEYTAIGKRVKVEGGPLKGVEGIVVGHRNDARVIVSITILQRSVATEVNIDWISAPASGAAT